MKPFVRFESAPAIVGALLFLALGAAIAGSLSPGTWSPNFTRSEESGTTPFPKFYRGDAILVTNAVAFVDAFGTEIQDLTDCLVVLALGDAASGSTAFTGTVTEATAGTFSVLVTIPTNSSDFQSAELTITDSITSNVFTYPPRTFILRDRI